ncbi:FtsK/SpoIIIE domain-containing protein [Streptomyces sp. DSM 44915]|uniref:FtsK/SpoIIIE domain-containing protein n=1 Tax=Streptomyces chisholmiae TaxID=3075540 RepID=A0ABU2JSG2_9ACTN|nr:FtsK/SpoIIIE domain-containing protein [Streptomyces sp. DSM 44915]MDT0267669.1 FtsK/SpoIIIE domain-containing protein [Streptomyces sp. DSM 44915]
MNLWITTSDARGHRADHLLDLPTDTTVGDLATALDAPRLYLDEQPLENSAWLGPGGVRDGALLGLDAPVPDAGAVDVWHPPAHDPALLELRHVSGPGAGRVWRLGRGTYEIGTARGCVVRLPDPDPDGTDATGDERVPAAGTWLTVHADGTASLRLPEDADPDLCGLRSLTPPPPVDPETGTPLTDEEPAGPEDGGPGGHSAEPAPPGPDGQPAPPPQPPAGFRPPPSDGSEPWPRYADLALGDHLLRLCPPCVPDAAVKPSEDRMTLEYSRPPRLTPHLDAETLNLPGPPKPQGPRPFPFLVMMSPLVMGLSMMFLVRSFYFVIMIFFTPMLAIGNWVSGRRANRKRYEEDLRRYRLRRAALEAEIRRAAVEERAQRNAASPDPATVRLTALGPGHQLWERRRHHPDYLTLRVGTVARASVKTVQDSARDANHRRVHWRLADVPVGVDLAQLGVVGITGTARTARALARWHVAQTAVLCSPRDLRIVILTEERYAADWEWVRWLPHLRPSRRGAAGTPLVAVGNDPASVAHRVGELYAEIQDRSGGPGSGHRPGPAGGPDLLVVLDGAWRLRDVPGVIPILTQGPGVRVFSLCLDEREHLLPEECNAIVTSDGNHLSLRSSGVRTVTGIRADQVEPDWCEEVARALAPVRDVTVEADVGVPTEVRLLPLLNQDPPDPEAVVAHWGRQPASTSFVIGAGYDGSVVLDLVKDGPHGLIAGTTGSGKSELLQTMIASLAAMNRPDELTFVLVDYKGGSAFRECADLPHTLGMITDLDGALVQRALASLAAELLRREHVLAEAGVKDHRDYRAKRARDPELAPLPRLLLVIDEFATLVRELPDFVPGLISLAQRGRSLGLHLVLATQRPAGAVSNDIRANTNLRVALRVTDRTESQDVLEAGHAAAISPDTPGRAFIRRGDGPPLPFQTAYVGAERPEPAEEGRLAAPAAGGGPRAVRRAPLEWGLLGHPVRLPAAEEEPAAAPDGDGAEHVVTDDPPTDLSVLVEALRAAAEALPDLTPQAQPWLPPLGQRLTLPKPDRDPAPGGAILPDIPFAVYDLPGQQAQVPGPISLDSFGHLYVIGAPRSGRTQVLRTIAGSTALYLASDQAHLYGIDAAGGGLRAIEALPHCGAVVPRDDLDRVGRLLRRLTGELSRRQALLAEHDLSALPELRVRLPREERPPHVLVLIDGWDTLFETLDTYDGGRLNNELFRLLREGLAAGVHVVATSERFLLGSRAGQHNDRRLMLRQTDPMDFSGVGIDRKRVPDDVPPGRGWFAPSGVEGQILQLPVAASGGGGDQADALREIGRGATVRDSGIDEARRPFRVGVLPTAIGFQQVMDSVPEEERRPMRALVGVGGDDVAPIHHDFARDSHTFLVVGPARSGRSTALAGMCVSLLMSGTSLLVITPRDSPLRELAAHGLATVMGGADPSSERIEEALERMAGQRVVVVVDDYDLLANGPADRALRGIAAAGQEQGRALLAAGPAEGLSMVGWLGLARRGRSGVLLGPRSTVEGDLIGAQLGGQHLRPVTVPGRALTGDGAGGVRAVQVPLTTLRG